MKLMKNDELSVRFTSLRDRRHPPSACVFSPFNPGRLQGSSLASIRAFVNEDPGDRADFALKPLRLGDISRVRRRW